MAKPLETSVRREDLVSVALGKSNADLVIKGGKILDVFSGETRVSDVAIKGERIAFVGDASHTIGKNTRVIDAAERYLSPGLIDAHFHIEASMVTPTQFARVILPRGNTAVLWEPLWIANVLGVRGIRFFLEEGNKTPLKLFVTAPSGVPPASPRIITPGQEFGINEIKEMFKWDKVVGLGELVRFNEVLDNDPEIHGQIRLAIKEGKTIDGSFPEMKAKALNAYVAAGAGSDHEAITLEDAIERIRLGYRLVIREGSSMHNLIELIKAVTEKKLSSRRCCFCVDDKDINEIIREGSIDYLVRKAIKSGVDPVAAVQMGSLNTAEYLGLDQDIGGIAPGRIADILIVDDLEDFSVQQVIINGKKIAEGGKLVIDLPQPTYPEWVLKTIHVKREIKPDDFAIRTEKRNRAKVRVMKVFPDQIVSVQEIESLPVKNGEIIADPTRDLLKIAMIERYGKTAPNIGKGFVRGFGFTVGAIASTVAPDVHQIIVVGSDNDNLSMAVNRLIEIHGGVVICKNGSILGELSLPVGGIISQEPCETIVAALQKLSKASKELGCGLPSPFMTLAFAGCPTLTSFKISDKGLIDIFAGKIVPLEFDE